MTARSHPVAPGLQTNVRLSGKRNCYLSSPFLICNHPQIDQPSFQQFDERTPPPGHALLVLKSAPDGHSS